MSYQCGKYLQGDNVLHFENGKASDTFIVFSYNEKLDVYELVEEYQGYRIFANSIPAFELGPVAKNKLIYYEWIVFNKNNEKILTVRACDQLGAELVAHGLLRNGAGFTPANFVFEKGQVVE